MELVIRYALIAGLSTVDLFQRDILVFVHRNLHIQNVELGIASADAINYKL
jgi:hypothetical protein